MEGANDRLGDGEDLVFLHCVPVLDLAYVDRLNETADVRARSDILGCTETEAGEGASGRTWSREASDRDTVQVHRTRSSAARRSSATASSRPMRKIA